MIDDNILAAIAIETKVRNGDLDETPVAKREALHILEQLLKLRESYRKLALECPPWV